MFGLSGCFSDEYQESWLWSSSCALTGTAISTRPTIINGHAILLCVFCVAMNMPRMKSRIPRNISGSRAAEYLVDYLQIHRVAGIDNRLLMDQRNNDAVVECQKVNG